MSCATECGHSSKIAQHRLSRVSELFGGGRRFQNIVRPAAPGRTGDDVYAALSAISPFPEIHSAPATERAHIPAMSALTRMESRTVRRKTADSCAPLHEAQADSTPHHLGAPVPSFGAWAAPASAAVVGKYRILCRIATALCFCLVLKFP